jgi:hypothetical protein
MDPSVEGEKKIALVFGGSGEQGRAVIEGLQEYSSDQYSKVYAFTHGSKNEAHENHGILTSSEKRFLETRNLEDFNVSSNLQYLTEALNAHVLIGDIGCGSDVKDALLQTKAVDIFLVTTTQLPTEIGVSTGYREAADDEFRIIVQFFHVIKECYNIDKIPRHVIFSVRDNVQDVTLLQVLKETGTLMINPLDDGSIVPHFSAKGKGGNYGIKYLQDEPNLQLTLITLPFLYTNFLGFFAPLPTDIEGRQNQWSFMACFGDGGNKIDMLSPQDLSYIVRKYFCDIAVVAFFLQVDKAKLDGLFLEQSKPMSFRISIRMLEKIYDWLAIKYLWMKLHFYLVTFSGRM